MASSWVTGLFVGRTALGRTALGRTGLGLLFAFVAGALAGCDPAIRIVEQSTLAADAAADTTAKPSTSTGQFADPAAPEVLTPPPIKPPQPKPYDRVTFHAPPKPLPPGAVTQDWVSFIGPTHNGVSGETKILRDWPADGPKVVWEMEKGSGYASPAIQGDYLVYPHRVGNEALVECLHPQTGKAYWQFKFKTVYADRYGYSNGPRASPVIDGDRVYIYSAEGHLFCLKLQTGQLFWKRELANEFKVPQDFFGAVTTPLIEGDLLIINVGAPGGPCVIGVHKQTGRVVWGAGDKWGPSYSSPVPATIHGKRRVFVFAGGDSRPPVGGLLSLDPGNGAIDFEFPWRSTSYESVNASCPVVIGDKILISATYKTGSALVKLTEDLKSEVVWTTEEMGTHWNTPIHRDGYLYAFDGRNEPDASLVCIDVKTGKAVWREFPEWDETIKFNGQDQTITLSTLRGCLLDVDGQFLCLGELGHLLWLDLTPKGYKELARTRLFFSQQTWALPVLSQGLLYVTQNSRDPLTRKEPRLVCYDLRAHADNSDK